MDLTENTSIIYNKILKLDPDNANQIMSFILRHHNNQEIMSYVSQSNAVTDLLIDHAMAHLCLIEMLQKTPSSSQIPPRMLRSSVPNNHHRYTQNQIPMNFEKRRRKPCDFYYRGHCLNGDSCKFVHDDTLHVPASLDFLDDDQGFAFNTPLPVNLDFLDDDECTFNTRKLFKLEAELVKLLSENNGLPISIAALPFVYLERYGKNLKVEYYLSNREQRGNTRVTLTDLLLQLKNLQLITRSHGQYEIALVDNASVCAFKDENNTSELSSRQIYLTFPPDCSFTDEDVAEYFSQYGPVREVRIPHQPQRMYGFVTFYDSETVRRILSEESPHFIYGNRVLAKPYREKTQIAGRKHRHQSESLLYDPETYTMPGGYDYSSFSSRSQTSLPGLENEYNNLFRHDDLSMPGINDQYTSLTMDRSFRTELKDGYPKLLRRQMYESEGETGTELQLHNDSGHAQVVSSNVGAESADLPNAEQCSDQQSNHIESPDDLSIYSFT